MNYYKKEGSYIASDLELELEQVTQEEYEAWEEKNARIDFLKGKLKETDDKSTRSVRSVLAGTATDEDREYLANLEQEAEGYRAELHELGVS